MQVSSLVACAIAAILLAPAGPTLAQQGETETPSVTPAPAPEDRVAEAPAASAESTRDTHLDALFERLADPEAQDWERIQNQIWRAWNHSGSDSMDLLASRADKAMETKNYDTALVHLNDLTRLAPEFAEGWNKRATLHFLRENYGPSLEDIARTLKLEPRHFGALSGLGIILDRIGDKKGALEAYRRALEIHPHLPGASEGIKRLGREVEGERL